MSARGSRREGLLSSPGVGAHALLVSDGDDLRSGTAAWVAHELDCGSKVFYKGWLAEGAGPEDHWLLGPDGVSRARPALSNGQLEFTDFPTVVARCGGTSEGLFRYQYSEVVGAISGGWPSVAMTQETTYRPMVDDVEAAAFADQEGGYDVLAQSFPLNTLCQLALSEESTRAVWESVATHHRRVVADRWSAHFEGDRWYVSGDLDASVEHEFAAALAGVVRGVSGDTAPDVVHVDLGAVDFLDAACALRLARAAPPDGPTRVVLHRCRPIVRQLLDVVGCPPSVVREDG